MSNIFDDLSDADLRNELLVRGINVGPVTPLTRKVYIKKLMNLAASDDAGAYTRPEKTFDSPRVNATVEDFGEHEATPESEEAVETVIDDINRDDDPPIVEESEEEYTESSRYVTREESMQRFTSPLARRRKQNKVNQFRIKFVLMVCLGALTALLFANFVVHPFMEKQKFIEAPPAYQAVEQPPPAYHSIEPPSQSEL